MNIHPVNKGRVSCCMKRVTDILDLKACTDGVTEALDDEDYETVNLISIDSFLSR